MLVAEELACATYEADLEANEIPVEADDVAMFRLNFLDAMVERVDQRVEPVTCARCASISVTSTGQHFGSGGAAFIASEYNRVGDFYRCPHCQHLNAPRSLSGDDVDDVDGDVAPPQQQPLPLFVRYVEHAANHLLSSYARLYYANKQASDDVVVTSTYAWLPQEDGSDNEGESERSDECPNSVGIAVYILHKHKGDAPHDEAGDGRGDGHQTCQWVSAHVAQARPSVDGTRFDFQSTVMVDLAQAGTTETQLGKLRLHGLVSTEAASFTGRPITMRASSSVVRQVALALVADLCEHLQRVENGLRDVIEALYIGKVGTMMAYSLRLHGPPSAATAMGLGARRESGQQVVETTPIDAASPDDEGQQPHHTEEAEAPQLGDGSWEACVDDEGNTYYYHTVTGETSWDRPSTGAGKEVVAAAVPEVAAGAATVLPPEGVVTSAMAVLDILESLSLSQPAEGYYKALRKYLKRFYDMKLDHDALLQLDDPAFTLGEGDDGSEGEQRQVLEVLVPIFGDRRKIRKWIAHRRAALEEEEGVGDDA